MQKLLIKNVPVATKEMNELLQQEWAIHADNNGYPEMLQFYQQDTSKRAARLLQLLKVSAKLTGYRCLLCAIPMVARDPCLLLKEIYPDVAKRCRLNDYRCVEHTIRTAIRKAWENRDDAVWSTYFPKDKTGGIICPTNKEFIARLAEEL